MEYTLQDNNKSTTLKECMWWSIFTICALWLQYFFQGTDMLVIGIIIATQEKRIRLTCILLCLFVILEESTGTLAFGMVLFWYCCVIGLVLIGTLLFAVKSFSFVLLLSITSVLVRCILLYIFSAIESAPVDWRIVAKSSLFQVCLMPLFWLCAYAVRKRCHWYGNTV